MIDTQTVSDVWFDVEAVAQGTRYTNLPSTLVIVCSFDLYVPNGPFI